MTLYELKENFLAALDGITVDEDTGEALGLDALDAVSAGLDEKLEQTALYRKSVAAEADAIRAEIEALTERLRAKQKKLTVLDGYIGETMRAVGKERLDTARVALSFRSSEKVEATDEAAIPAAYWRETVKREIDKAKIKAAIRAGETVPGAEIVRKQNLQIK